MNNRFLYCERLRFPFFEDYIKTFIKPLSLELIIVDDLNTVEYNQTDIYFFIGRLPKCAFFKPKIKSLFINMEQLSKNSYLTYCQTINKFNIPVINYNESNQRLFPNSILLRYQYEEISFPLVKTYDIAFVGSLGLRRKKILTELQENGFQIHVIEGWGKERDKEILQAKILLNIHYDEDYNIYESLRCDRFLFNDMIIVTESSKFQELLDVNDLLIVADYNNLVLKVKEVLQNYPQYIENLKIKSERILPSIIESRKEDLLQVENILNG